MRNALIALGILVLLVGAFFAVNAYIYNEKQADGPQPALAAYFEDRMITLGIEDVGHPIEGFDSEMLMMAYPGLQHSDFADVEAFEGKYVIQNNEAVFVRSQSQPVSSAERTVSSAGYATLLSNLSARLSHPTYSDSDVDALIRKIDTGQRIETRIDEGAGALGVKVTPLEILEDSRCPMDVQCIQAGTVRVRATLESGLGTADQVFVLNQPITTEAEEVTLVSVSPMPEAGIEIAEKDYIFIFQVEKRQDLSAGAPEGDEPVFCTADAMQCPDGSWVGRTGPKCQFVCP